MCSEVPRAETFVIFQIVQLFCIPKYITSCHRQVSVVPEIDDTTRYMVLRYVTSISPCTTRMVHLACDAKYLRHVSS